MDQQQKKALFNSRAKILLTHMLMTKPEKTNTIEYDVWYKSINDFCEQTKLIENIEIKKNNF